MTSSGPWARWCVTCAVLMCAVAQLHEDNEEHMSPVPFLVGIGTRYGRSSDRVSPRNDRFFLAGRYGKRSEPRRAGEEGGGGGGNRSEGVGGKLYCRYTGVLMLYTCVRRQHSNNAHDRLTAVGARR